MAKLDLTKNQPKDKRDLTKENMMSYIEKQSDEDQAWFAKLCLEHPITRTNNLDGKDITTYDWEVIREAFAQKYFYSISKKGKKEAKKEEKKNSAKNNSESFEDKLKKMAAKKV